MIVNGGSLIRGIYLIPSPVSSFILASNVILLQNERRKESPNKHIADFGGAKIYIIWTRPTKSRKKKNEYSF